MDSLSQQKINYFKQVTYQDEETAKRYLSRNNWVSQDAINNYYQDKYQNNSNSRGPSQNNQYQPHQEPSAFAVFMDSTFGALGRLFTFNSCGSAPEEEKKEETNSRIVFEKETITKKESVQLEKNQNQPQFNENYIKDVEKLFNEFPNKTFTLSDYWDKVRFNPGIIIVFNEYSVTILENLLNSIKADEGVYKILKDNYNTLLLDGKSNNFKNLNKGVININKFPSILIIDKGLLNYVGKENLYILLEDQHLNFANFKQHLMIHYKEQFPNDIQIKEEVKISSETIEIKNKLTVIPNEPSDNDENSYLIIFRAPKIDFKKERRFLKTEKIKSLYDFVAYHAKEFHVTNFTLNRPFLGGITNMEKTIEEENLNNAIVQVTEK